MLLQIFDSVVERLSMELKSLGSILILREVFLKYAYSIALTGQTEKFQLSAEYGITACKASRSKVIKQN